MRTLLQTWLEKMAPLSLHDGETTVRTKNTTPVWIDDRQGVSWKIFYTGDKVPSKAKRKGILASVAGAKGPRQARRVARALTQV